jgi:anti-sigma factor ChrR (cupin superfamily)
MVLQDINPINDQLADIIVRAGEPWVETAPGMAWTKVLWTGPETGRWVALFRWNKGYIAPPHKHLSDAHTYVLKGPVVFFDDDGITRYLSWEEMQQLKDSAPAN